MNDLPLFIPESRKPVIPVAARPLTIKRPPGFVQPEMLDVRPNKPISANGEARTRYGACVNEIVNALLGLEDIPNSGSHDVVFDSFHRPTRTFVEVKSLRRGNKIPCYRWRIDKDKAAGVPLVYIIGIHDCKRCDDMDLMWQRMSDTLDTVLVLPASRIAKLALAEPLQTIGSHRTASGDKNGYQRKGYKEGYHNIPWAKLDDGMQGSRLHHAELHGLDFSTNVFFHRTLTPWLPPV